MGMISEFKEFVSRGNVVDLAVGVVIGAAFGKIVTALVDGIVRFRDSRAGATQAAGPAGTGARN